jgi:hypothetical protein
MIIDTGSANTAVAATTCCEPNTLMSNDFAHGFDCASSPTCFPYRTTNETNVFASYALGSWNGSLVQDVFTSPSHNQSFPSVPFALITSESRFFTGEFDGILGLAFRSIANPPKDPPPDYIEDLSKKQLIARDMFGLQLCGILQLPPSNMSSTTSASDATKVKNSPNMINEKSSGHLILGGVAAPNQLVLYRGNIITTPLVQRKWYVLVVTDIGFNDTSLGLNCIVYNSPKVTELKPQYVAASIYIYIYRYINMLHVVRLVGHR